MVLLAFAENAVQLVPDGTIFIHIGMILAMIWVLNKTFYRPIARVIDARDSRKGGGRGPAGEILDDVAAKEAKYSAEIKETRLKVYEVVSGERDKALAAKQEIVADAKREVAEMTAKENAELDRQTAEARAAISADAEKIADKIAASILKG